MPSGTITVRQPDSGSRSRPAELILDSLAIKTRDSTEGQRESATGRFAVVIANHSDCLGIAICFAVTVVVVYPWVEPKCRTISSTPPVQNRHTMFMTKG